MSTLSQFTAGGIKSVQRGVVTPTGTSRNVTIPVPVDTAKSTLSVSCENGIDRYTDNSNASHYNSTTSSVRIANSTTLVVETQAAYTFTLRHPTVSWEVVEFY